MRRSRIPVWLLTGWLGSGKTTLLGAWLRDPALADAALVVNEIGEVGLDDRLLAGSAVDAGASLIADACVCCTGLPGLEQALAELYWDRLQRRRPRFGTVLIETTGLADPRGVVAALDRVPLLAERYRLAGVVAAAGATAGTALLEGHAEARAQVECADVLVVTKVDRADGAPLAEALRLLNARAGIAFSACASLGWDEVRSLAEAARSGRPAAGGHTPAHGRRGHDHDRERGHGDGHGDGHGHGHGHGHDAAARFVPLPAPLSWPVLAAVLDALRGAGLLRLKGVVRLDDGRLQAVQWSAGDDAPVLAAFDGEPPPLGLTLIERTGGRSPSALPAGG